MTLIHLRDAGVSLVVAGHCPPEIVLTGAALGGCGLVDTPLHPTRPFFTSSSAAVRQ